MRSLTLSALLLGCVGQPQLSATKPGTLIPASRPTSRADEVLVGRVDSFTKARVAIDSLSGVVLLTHDGVPIYAFAAGFADRSTGARNDLDTKFNLASVDKYFTRIAIWQLAQAGKLAVNDTVGKHIRDYPNARVRSSVTIRQLLDMRSGIGDFDDDNGKTYRAALPRLRTIDDYLALFATDTLNFAPGTKAEYSNGGYVVLGKIIERASGESYYDYVRRHIFEPAGMSNTGYWVRGERVANLAIGYTADPSVNGETTPGALPLKERRPNTSLLAYRGSSAGGGYSTANDLLKLANALSAHRLLNTAFTDSLLRIRRTGPGEFDFDGWQGGAEGINTSFYMHSTGHTLIVLSNYDPPSANVYRAAMWREWLPEWLKLAK
ncbi:MAG TPA: serine hydrolase [Gemmatimonadaceae bacterium]|nr:serine hydrolase [Gemmatimonadaceae bacterium]